MQIPIVPGCIRGALDYYISLFSVLWWGVGWGRGGGGLGVCVCGGGGGGGGVALSVVWQAVAEDFGR